MDWIRFLPESQNNKEKKRFEMDMALTKTYSVYCILLFYGVLTCRAAKPEGAGGQLLDFWGSSVYPIPTKTRDIFCLSHYYLPPDL